MILKKLKKYYKYLLMYLVSMTLKKKRKIKSKKMNKNKSKNVVNFILYTIQNNHFKQKLIFSIWKIMIKNIIV